MTDLGPIQYLTLHCAATPDGRDVKTADICAWDQAKFGQTSYHWVIELDGSMHRTLQDNELGAHVHLHNHYNIGVCYIGGVDEHGNPKDTRTTAQKLSQASLIAHYRAINPKLIVLGHNEWPAVAKACPSFSVREWLGAGMPAA